MREDPEWVLPLLHPVTPQKDLRTAGRRQSRQRLCCCQVPPWRPQGLMARRSDSARKIERQRKSAQDGSLNFPGPGCPQEHHVSVPDCRAEPPIFSRRRQEVRMDADRPAEAFFLFPRAVAQPLAALPPTDAAYPLRVRRICLRLNAAASGGWLRHAPAGAVFLVASKRKWGARSHPSVGTGIRTASAGWSPPCRRRPPGP